MKPHPKSLLVFALSLGALAATARAGSFYQEVDSGWAAGYAYSVPCGANVEADANGNGSWAHTQVSGDGIGPGGGGLNLEAGYGQASYWIGTTTSAGDVYYNLSADGEGASSLLAISW